MNFSSQMDFKLSRFSVTENTCILLVIYLFWYMQTCVQLVRLPILVNAKLSFNSRTTYTQWRHKSEKSKILGRYGRHKYGSAILKIWDWDLIFGRAVKAFFSPGVRSPWFNLFATYLGSCKLYSLIFYYSFNIQLHTYVLSYLDGIAS